MRAFFCLPIDEAVRVVIGRAADRIRRETRMSASWVETANYHVTLRFLGEIDPLATVELETLATRAAASCPAFSLVFEEIGGFPSLDRARVVWAGGETPEAFRMLAESLERGVVDLGFPREPKPAVAHVTIARLKGAPDARLAEVASRLVPLRAPACAARSMVLMQSELTPGGARYTPLFSMPLGKE